MTEQELFRKVHGEILDYVEDELILRCADWGYEVYQTLLKNDRSVVQAGAENSSPFMYAVATAIIISKFAEGAFNDYFDDDAIIETIIDLDLLGMDFEEIRGFLDDGIAPERLKLLKDTNSVELRDIRTAIWEWKSDIHKTLVEIYKEYREKDPNYRIFVSLLNLYKNTDERGVFYRSMTDIQKQEAYGFVSGGFEW